MHRVRAGLAHGVHDLVDDDIGLVGGRRPDMHRLIRHSHMQRLAVGVGIDGDRRDPHLPCGFDDAASDLTAIGDEDFLQHCVPM